MTAAWTIAFFEVWRRRGFVLGALVLGFVPLVVMALSEGPDLADTCTLGVVVVSWIVAFVTGMTLVGAPLHDNRLAFYFTRPINAFAIAAGKVAGGLALVAMMEIVLITPVIESDHFGDKGPTVVVGLTVVFLAAGLVVGILARSRSRWFLADVLGATVAALLAVVMFGQLDAAQQYAIDAGWTFEPGRLLLDRMRDVVQWVEIGATVAVFIAVVVAIGVGRTERERVHQVLAMSLWSGVAAVLLVGCAFARWGLL